MFDVIGLERLICDNAGKAPLDTNFASMGVAMIALHRATPTKPKLRIGEYFAVTGTDGSSNTVSSPVMSDISKIPCFLKFDTSMILTWKHI